MILGRHRCLEELWCERLEGQLLWRRNSAGCREFVHLSTGTCLVVNTGEYFLEECKQDLGFSKVEGNRFGGVRVLRDKSTVDTIWIDRAYGYGSILLRRTQNCSLPDSNNLHSRQERACLNWMRGADGRKLVAHSGFEMTYLGTLHAYKKKKKK